MLNIEITHKYKRAYAMAKKRGFPMEELDDVVKMLAEEKFCQKNIRITPFTAAMKD